MSNELPEFSPELLEEINRDPLLGESDRGCVLILAADVENQLFHMLKDMFTQSNGLSRKEEKNIFDYSGPLGTFSSKIYLAKAIGVIDKNLHDDIHKLRSIRNMAAHHNDSFSLSDEKVLQITSSMHHYAKGCLPRYDLKDHFDQGVKPHESIMKGHGYLRADKALFIITVKNIELELSMYKHFSSDMGELIRDTREKYIHRARKFIEMKKKVFNGDESPKENENA